MKVSLSRLEELLAGKSDRITVQAINALPALIAAARALDRVQRADKEHGRAVCPVCGEGTHHWKGCYVGLALQDIER